MRVTIWPLIMSSIALPISPSRALNSHFVRPIQDRSLSVPTIEHQIGSWMMKSQNGKQLAKQFVKAFAPKKSSMKNLRQKFFLTKYLRQRQRN